MPRFGNYQKNILVEQVAVLPLSPKKGRVVFLTTTNQEHYFDGTNWIVVAAPLGKFSQDIGDGTLTTLPVTHNLNTSAVVVSIIEKSTGEAILTDVTVTSANEISVIFADAPTTDQYTITIIG
jgi:hypothetical protein